MRAGSKLAVLLVAALALSAAKPAPPKVEFPGPGVAADPAGRYLIQWRAASYAAPHELLLTDIRSQTSVVLWEFPRQISVLWAPGGKHVALTDFGGSALSDVLVFRLSDSGPPVRLSSVLKKATGSWKARLGENATSHIEAVRWVSDSTLELRVWGGDEPEHDGSDVFLDYRIGGGLKEPRP